MLAQSTGDTPRHLGRRITGRRRARFGERSCFQEGRYLILTGEIGVRVVRMRYGSGEGAFGRTSLWGDKVSALGRRTVRLGETDFP